MSESVMVPNKIFWNMLQAYHNQQKSEMSLNIDHPIIGLDPGETTGYAYWNPIKGTFKLEQLITKNTEDGYKAIRDQITYDVGLDLKYTRLQIVCEDYRVYSWKADTHAWAGLHTPQLIGAIKIYAMLNELPIHFQMAQEAKSWATDAQLKTWSLYDPGQRHARDASRHIIRHMFFHKPK